MDLRDWMRPDRGRALLDLIDQCPSACRWREAAQLDPWVAAQQADDPKTQEKWAPRISEFTLEALLLIELRDLIGVVAQGKQLKRLPPFPRPKTAAKAVQMQRTLADAEDIIGQLMGKRG